MLRGGDSFDTYTTSFLPASQIWDSATAVTIVADAGRSGFVGDNAAFFNTTLGSVLTKAWSPTIYAGVYTATWGLALRPLTCESSATVFSVSTASNRFDLKITEWGSLELYQFFGGSPLGLVCQSADGIVPIGTGGVYVEIQFISDTTLPRPITIRASDQYGAMQPVASGIYLTPTIDIITSFQHGGGSVADLATWYLDDVYWTDGVPAVTPLNYQGRNVRNDSFLGNTHLTSFYMTADGIAQAVGNVPWTPNAGSTVYTQINEHPPDEDVTYVSADTIDQRSTGLFESPEARPFGRQGCCAFAPIFGLIWLGRLRMDLTGAGEVVPVIRRISGGTFATDIVEVGDPISVETTDWAYYPQVLERDPTNGNKPYTFAVFFPAGVGVPGTVEFGIQKTG